MFLVRISQGTLLTKGKEIAIISLYLGGVYSDQKEEREMASVLKVKGMSCQHCVMSVTKALNKLEGIRNVKVDLPKGEVSFDNTKALAPDKIEKTIEDAGYQVVKG